MIAYASRTGTRRNLAALRRAGWRLMVSARGVLRHEGFQYSLDNGAWTAHQRGEPFDVAAFERAVQLLGAEADFIVAPDIVCGGLESLAFSLPWLERLPGLRLLAVQNGMEPRHLVAHIGPSVGIFVGGDTEWKEASLPVWGELKRKTGCYLHVGRVNSARRIRLCALAGADSFDGSCASRFSCRVPDLDRARRQSVLDFGEAT